MLAALIGGCKRALITRISHCYVVLFRGEREPGKLVGLVGKNVQYIYISWIAYTGKMYEFMMKEGSQENVLKIKKGIKMLQHY